MRSPARGAPCRTRSPGGIAKRAQEQQRAAERQAQLADQRYADRLGTDDEHTQAVILRASAIKRTEAEQASAGADAALDALNAAESPQAPDAELLMAELWEALSARVDAARGDVKALNLALRELFEAMVPYRDTGGVLKVQPRLGGDTVRRILRGEAKAPPHARVTVAGYFEHEGEPAMLVEVNQDPITRKISPALPRTPARGRGPDRPWARRRARGWW